MARVEAAVERQDAAVHELRGVRGEEHDRPYEVVRLADAPHRRPALEVLQQPAIGEDLVGHRRIEEVRGERVDADATVGPFARQQLRQVVYSALRSEVARRAPFEPAGPKDGADVDDVAVPLAQHVLGGRVAAVPQPREVRVEDVRERLRLRVLGPQAAGVGDAGVVDEHIDVPELIPRLLHHRRHLGRVGHVAADCRAAAAFGFDHRLRLFELVGASGGYDDVGAGIGQSGSKRQAETVARASDDRDFSFE